MFTHTKQKCNGFWSIFVLTQFGVFTKDHRTQKQSFQEYDFVISDLKDTFK